MSHLAPATYLPYHPSANGVGMGQLPVGAIFTTLIGAGLAVSTEIFKIRADARADRSARHEAGRQRQHELNLQAAAAAQQREAMKLAAANAAITAGATGGVVAYDAQGQLLPPSGVATLGTPLARMGISRNMMLIGVAGVVGIGLIALIGKRG